MLKKGGKREKLSKTHEAQKNYNVTYMKKLFSTKNYRNIVVYRTSKLMCGFNNLFVIYSVRADTL